jgi:hypothetical protein
MDSLLDEGLALFEKLAGQDDHARRTITHLSVLVEEKSTG